MSFILDALKKSESDRQRQNGPALFEVRVAPPRVGLPPWAIAIAALLIVNLGIVVWMLTRQAPPAAGAPPAAAAESASATSPAVPVPSPVAAAPAAAPAAAAPAAAPGPVGQTAGPAAALPRTATDQAATSSSVAGPNPDDYAPAAEPTASTGFGGQVSRGTGEGVPLYRQSAAAAQLPQLHLDLHAYAEKPADRWAMINMHKVREGDSLPQGVHVEQITPDGVVLSFQGQQFLLTRE